MTGTVNKADVAYGTVGQLKGGAHPLFAAFCRRRVGRFAAMIAAKSGKFYTIFSGILSLNRQVLPNIL